MKPKYGFFIFILTILIFGFSTICYAEEAAWNGIHYQSVLTSAISLFSQSTCKSINYNPQDALYNSFCDPTGVDPVKYVLCDKIEQCGKQGLGSIYIGSGTGSYWWNLGINLYDGTKLVDRNYLLNQDDKVCVGDTLKLDSTTMYGEWFVKGGPTDSPPITFVSREEFISIMQNYAKNYNRVPNTALIKNGTTVIKIESDENIIGKKIRMDAGGYLGIYAAIICTSNTKMNSSSPIIDSKIKVSSSGNITFDIESEPSCMIYVENTPYGSVMYVFYDFTTRIMIGPPLVQIELTDPNNAWVDQLKVGKSSTQFTLQAMETTEEPDLKIIDYSLQGNNIRFLVKNSGDLEAKLDGIDSNVQLDILEKTKIPAGQTVEVYAKLQDVPQTEKLNFNLIYRTDELGCLKTKEYGIKTGFVGCKYNSECSSIMYGTCCQGKCQDSREGVCRDENSDGIMEWILFG